MSTHRAYVALGGNLGDRRATLERAVDLLGRTPGVPGRRRGKPGVRVVAVSGFLETAPAGGPPGQPKYLNAAVAIETTLSPAELLAALHRIESALGRDRAAEVRWGPRTCDLDILLMGATVMRTKDLTIPHPRMHERLFVLRPLAQIAPRAVHPVLRKTVRRLLRECEGQQYEDCRRTTAGSIRAVRGV